MNRKKLDILIKDLIDNNISFKVIPSCDSVEMDAGYNQAGLKEILKKHEINYVYDFGHYWWKI